MPFDESFSFTSNTTLDSRERRPPMQTRCDARMPVASAAFNLTVSMSGPETKTAIKADKNTNSNNKLAPKHLSQARRTKSQSEIPKCKNKQQPIDFMRNNLNPHHFILDNPGEKKTTAEADIPQMAGNTHKSERRLRFCRDILFSSVAITLSRPRQSPSGAFDASTRCYRAYNISNDRDPSNRVMLLCAQNIIDIHFR